jgi:hypothetical protein
LPYTQDTIDRLILLSEGCANTNYKVTFKNGKSPVVIRIYVREASALSREVAIQKHQMKSGDVIGFMPDLTESHHIENSSEEIVHLLVICSNPQKDCVIT